MLDRLSPRGRGLARPFPFVVLSMGQDTPDQDETDDDCADSTVRPAGIRVAPPAKALRAFDATGPDIIKGRSGSTGRVEGVERSVWAVRNGESGPWEQGRPKESGEA